MVVLFSRSICLPGYRLRLVLVILLFWFWIPAFAGMAFRDAPFPFLTRHSYERFLPLTDQGQESILPIDRLCFDQRPGGIANGRYSPFFFLL